MDGHVPADAAIRTQRTGRPPRHKGGCRIAGMTSGIRLYMAGMALVQCLMPGGLIQAGSSHDVLPADGFTSVSRASQSDISPIKDTLFIMRLRAQAQTCGA